MQNAPDIQMSAFVAQLDLGDAKGLRVAIKDCLDIADSPTRCGSAAAEGTPAARGDTDIVQALLAAGCHITDKTRMPALDSGTTKLNAQSGTPVNPIWPDRIAGGSSAGAAVAVASGAVDFAIGTDTGGSIRQSAICCGVIGFKPSYDQPSRRAVSPAESSLNCIGPIARSIPMIEAAMTAMDPSFAPTTLTRAPKIARVDCRFDRRIADSLLFPMMEQGYIVPRVLLQGFDDASRAEMIISAAETYAAFGNFLAQDSHLDEDNRARLEAAGKILPADLIWAEAVRRDFSAEIDLLLEDYDAILTPALPIAPPLLTQAQDPAAILPLTKYLRPINLSGHPAIVLPVKTRENLPAGLQIIGRKSADAELCAIASWFCETVPKFKAHDFKAKG